MLPTSTIQKQQHRLLNKVPEITIYFWIIKVLCTTVGETAADFLNVNLGFGLTGTSIVTGIVLAIALAAQFRAPRYVAGLYWSTVALVSVFGTLVTDNLTDNIGIPLQTSATVFAIALAAIFIVWYKVEGTLSIHSIVTHRRETFYWLTVLVTFALGTATGDLMSEALSLGYLVSALIVSALIAIVAVAWRLGLNEVLAFWLVYILTRPLGASLGDLLAQAKDQGGLGLGATITSVIFLTAILLTVVYLSIAKPDVTASTTREITTTPSVESRSGLIQTVAVVAVLTIFGSAGYSWRKTSLADSPATPEVSTNQAAGTMQHATSPNAKLGDLSQFRTITQDTLTTLTNGDQSGATNRIADLETAWDNAQGKLQARDKQAWTRIDDKIDTTLKALRAKRPNVETEKLTLNSLLNELN